MVKNKEITKNERTANDIYSLCRLYQARQAKGSELTESELENVNMHIELEVEAHAVITVPEWRLKQEEDLSSSDKQDKTESGLLEE